MLHEEVRLWVVVCGQLLMVVWPVVAGCSTVVWPVVGYRLQCVASRDQSIIRGCNG